VSETADKIRTLAAEGRTPGQIAEAIGRTRSRVHQIASAHGIELPRAWDVRRRALSPTVCRAVVKEAHRRGGTVLEVLHDLGVWAESPEGPEVEL
jgi:hypothetical protein